MSGDLNVALRITARDDGSKVVSNSLKEVAKATENVNKANAQADNTSKSWSQNSSKGAKVVSDSLKAVAKSTEEAARSTNKLADEQKRANDAAVVGSRTLTEEYRRSASARETLGIRAERTIQREIQQTEAAYNRLARSGTMSAQEQTRAYTAMKSKVGELRREMAGLNGDMKTGSSFLQNTMSIIGGVTAGSALLHKPVSQQMSYSEKLADMSNTAFSDRTVEGRIAGKKELDSAITNAVNKSGGTVDMATDSLNELFKSGQFSKDSAMNLLPTIQKFAVATKTDPADLIKLVTALKANFKISDADMPKALDMATAGGQKGSFELKDMAKWLAEQLPNASSQLGMSGLKDYARIIALNQSSALVTGSSDKAGNNVSNLLGKLVSTDTENNFKSHYKIRSESTGKTLSVAGYLAEQRGRGVDPIVAFNGLIDKTFEGNKEYQKLLARSKAAKGKEKDEILKAMETIIEGSVISQIIPDKESRQALIGYRNKEFVDDVYDTTVNKSNGEGDKSHAVMMNEAALKAQQLESQKQLSENRSFESFNNTLGDVSLKLAEYAKAYPELTDAVTKAGYTFGTAAAVVGAGLIINRATSGGGSSWLAELFSSGAKSGGGNILGALGRVFGVAGSVYMAYDHVKDTDFMTGRRSADNQVRIDADLKKRGLDPNSPEAQLSGQFAKMPTFWDVWDDWFGGKSTSPAVLNNAMPQSNYPANINIKSELKINERVIAEAVNSVNVRDANRR